MDWPLDPDFYIPEDVAALYIGAIAKGKAIESEWKKALEEYKKEFPELASDFERIFSGKLPRGWDADLVEFPADEKGIATRAASGKVINAIAPNLPDLIGGSADLEPSNKTWIDGSPAFQADSPQGRNFHFGVREHGMASIVNGMALYPGIIPYGGTFLVFSDYMRGALRLSALSHYPSIWIFTHDSIGVGEDGPTHQPVEHIAALRSIPGLLTIRPCDANETLETWRVAITRRDGPTALLLSRQGLPILDRIEFSKASELAKGAYILADLGEEDPEIILMASGSEVSLIIGAGKELAAKGHAVRLVSFPSWELFESQSEAYKASVFPTSISARLAVEAGVSMGWQKYVGDQGKVIAVDKFGASAPAIKVFAEYGFTIENVVNQALSILK
jgi:transketolase